MGMAGGICATVDSVFPDIEFPSQCLNSFGFDGSNRGVCGLAKRHVVCKIWAMGLEPRILKLLKFPRAIIHITKEICLSA